jgi:hypothetical protein
MDTVRPKTRTELQEMRKRQLRNLSTSFIENYIKSHPHLVEIANPVQAPKPSFITPYVSNPSIQTKRELDLIRRQEGVEINESTVNFACKTLSERVEERDRNLSSNSRPATISNRTEDRKKTDIHDLKEKFSKRPVGVHGTELPKFSEHLLAYWKLRQGYIENPVVPSRERPPSRPISEFVRLRVKSSSVDEQITLKPGEVNPFPGFVPPQTEGQSMRASSRSRDSVWESKINSLVASQERIGQGVSKRPGTAGEKRAKKQRPMTAASQGRSGDKTMIRSSGFFLKDY